MNDEPDLIRAEELEGLLVRVMRSLFTLDPEPVTAQLPVAQLRICSILLDGPRTMTSMSEETGISMSGLTQIAARLERAGFVERVVPRHDRRMRMLQLTPLGEQMMRHRKETRVRSAAAAFARLTPAEQDRLLASLQSLLEASRAAHRDDKVTR